MPPLLMFRLLKSSCARTVQDPSGHIWFHLETEVIVHCHDIEH